MDKTGCISFLRQKYEVGLAGIGQTVDVVYDPQSPDDIAIDAPGQAPRTVHPLVIGEQVGRRPALPDHLGPIPATQSRVLRAAETRSQSAEAEPTPAVSYRNWVDEGGAPHV